ncbi:P-loop NTPase fold protein [Picosynechococcus sp. NKBG042902]
MTTPIQKSLDNFLEDDNFKVMIVKGSWGAGKTFFIQKYLQEKKI